MTHEGLRRERSEAEAVMGLKVERSSSRKSFVTAQALMGPPWLRVMASDIAKEG